MAAEPVGTELLDDPRADPTAVRAQLEDIVRLNRWFGGTGAVVGALDPLFRRANGEAGDRKRVVWTLLDIGTGAGDIPVAARAAARRHGVELLLFGLERIPAAAGLARRRGVSVVVGDGSALPFAPKCVDIVIASQVLHHLPPAVAVRWIAAFDCLARRAVVVADLRRSRAAMAGVWLAAAPLGMSGTTRHDAVLSLRRGYSAREFARLFAAAGVRATVRRRRWSRLVAAWAPQA